MKTILTFFITIIFIMTTSATFAKGYGKHCKGHGGEMHQIVFEQLLELNDEQKSAIKEIRQEGKKKMKNRLSKKNKQGIYNLDPAAPNYLDQVTKIAKHKADRLEAKIILKAETRAKIFALLTAEQQDKMRSIRQEMHERKQKKIENDDFPDDI